MRRVDVPDGGTRPAALRNRMVDQLATDGVVTDQRLIDALRAVPRHLCAGTFVVPGRRGSYVRFTQLDTGPGGADARESAWERVYDPDQPLVVQFADDGRPDLVMSSAADTARLLAAAHLTSRDLRVLLVGTGTGYTAAVLARLVYAGGITALEIDPAIDERAHGALAACGVEVLQRVEDGRLGYDPRADFDAIVSTCDVVRVPSAWIRQLKPSCHIATTMAGQIITLTKTSTAGVHGRFVAAPRMTTTALRIPHEGSRAAALAELAQREDGYVVEMPPPGGSVEHPTLAWLRELVYPEVTFLAEDNGYVALDPDSGSWARAIRGSRQVAVGGPRTGLWRELLDLWASWEQAGRPTPDQYGMTASTFGVHELWLRDPQHTVITMPVGRH
jgi:protein-L-isoaspartate O-methyltransferase